MYKRKQRQNSIPMIKTLDTQGEGKIYRACSWGWNMKHIPHKTKNKAKGGCSPTADCAGDPSTHRKVRKRKKKHTDRKVKSVIGLTHQWPDCTKSNRIYF